MQQLPKNTLLQGGKYKIEKVLGQGGFGITYLATQELLDRKVCIKEFFFKEYCERNEATSHVSLGTQSNHEIVERFMNKFLKEARTIFQLEHPHIIRIHDIFKENNTAYYVMEYIEGESLADKVNHYGALPETEAVEYIKQVASALDFIHRQSINHLDVKPANIMIRRSDNKAVLIDFGLSKQYDEQGSQTSTTPVGISHGYAPMEQYKQGGVSTFSPQTDIYALGATLYKLVTGNTPPQAMDILDEGLPSLPSLLSPSVADAIKKAMQPRKVDRPENMEEFLKLLTVANSEQPNTEKKVSVFQQKSNVDEETKIIEEPKQSPKVSQYKKEEEKPKPTITIPSHGEEERQKPKINQYAIGGLLGFMVSLCFIYVSGNNEFNFWTGIILGIISIFYLYREIAKVNQIKGKIQNPFVTILLLISLGFVGLMIGTNVDLSIYELYNTSLSDESYSLLFLMIETINLFLLLVSIIMILRWIKWGVWLSFIVCAFTFILYSIMYSLVVSLITCCLYLITLPIVLFLKKNNINTWKQLSSSSNSISSNLPSEGENVNIIGWKWVLLCIVGLIGWFVYYCNVQQKERYEQRQTEIALQEEQKVREEEQKKEQAEAERKAREAENEQQAHLAAARKVEEKKNISKNESITIQTGIINGHAYVDLGLSVKWATCNVGASSPEDYGNYYAWSDIETRAEYNSIYSAWFHENMNIDIGGNSLYDAARANWGDSWRLPTKAEFQELLNNCKWNWTKQGGKRGYKVVGRNGNSIFLPAAGHRSGSSLYTSGLAGYYWSSTPNSNDFGIAPYILKFDDDEMNVHFRSWGEGLNVRPVSK